MARTGLSCVSHHLNHSLSPASSSWFIFVNRDNLQAPTAATSPSTTPLMQVASNETSNASILLTQGLGAASNATKTNLIGYTVTGVVIAFTLLLRLLTVKSSAISCLDPREPPALKSWWPYYGFIIGLWRRNMAYFDDIRPGKAPIATVQLYGNKAYIAWSAKVVQTCLRHRDLDIRDMGIAFAEAVFGMPRASNPRPNQVEPVFGLERDDEIQEGESANPAKPKVEQPQPVRKYNPLDGLLYGPELYQINLKALRSVADMLNAIPDNGGLEIPNLYRWVRKHIFMATTDAFMGANNPFRADPSLVDAFTDYDEARIPSVLGQGLLTIRPGGGPLGSWEALASREKAYRGLLAYVESGSVLDDDVSEFVKGSVLHMRSQGCNNEQVARRLIPAVWVATVNTIPTLYWFLTGVLLRPQLVERVCRELEADAASEKPVLRVTKDASWTRTAAVIDVSQVERACPSLLSCFREAGRIGSQLFGMRRINEDITVADEEGNTFLLKKGHDVIWSVRTIHREEQTWPNPLEFDPDRFMPQRGGSAAEKEQRKRDQEWYIPFGGGKHFCPGRNFALAENIGFVAAVVMGYRIDGLKKKNVKMALGRVNDAITAPVHPDGEGGRVSMCRKEGWEGVERSYAC